MKIYINFVEIESFKTLSLKFADENCRFRNTYVLNTRFRSITENFLKNSLHFENLPYKVSFCKDLDVTALGINIEN